MVAITMLRDWLTPDSVEAPSALEHHLVDGLTWEHARWRPKELSRLARVLRPGGRELRELDGNRVLAAWEETVESFLDPRSDERRGLGDALTVTCRLSPAGLEAGLVAVLGGVVGQHAERVFAAARPAADPSPVLVVLASNLPALAVQPLLPILALRRPAVLKSASAEPLFAPAFAAALARREPAVGRAVAALTWRGGRAELEEPLLAAVGRVLAYGDEAAIADLRRRAPGKLVPYGPKTSLAVLGPAADVRAAAAGLARDVALFDQRGCLSIAAVYTAGDAGALAAALAAELTELARRWPPGPISPAEAAAVRLVRDEAAMRGLVQPDLPLPTGTVIVEPEAAFRPTPGLRTVRIHPLPDLARLPAVLAPWKGRLQGIAHAGLDQPETLLPLLRSLGASRFAPPGELQSPDTRWHNGGIDPLEILS
jgi:hypothetical protein